jgi:MFS family permease
MRTASPLIDVRIMLDPQIGVTLLVMALIALGAMNVGQIVMVMLQQPVATGVGLGASATLAGPLHMPASLVGAVAGPLCGWYAGRHGGRGAMLMGTSIATLAWAGLATAHDDIWLVTIWMLLSSFSMGAMMAAVPNLIVEAAPAGRTSEAMALAQIGRKIFMAVGAQLVAIAMASSTIRAEGGSFPDQQAYDLTYGGVALLCLFAFALSFRLPRRTQRPGSKQAARAA